MKKILLACALVLASSAPVWAADAVLTWTANTEADLAGYKVYRANQNCTAFGPLPLITTLGKVVTYTDPNLPAFDGVMCWELTAYDTSGNISGPSNRVSKTLNTLPPQAPAGLGVVIQ